MAQKFSMNIALDLDGVLWDIESFQLKYGEKYFRRRGIAMVNPNGFGIREMFQCSSREEKKFWATYLVQGFFTKAREQAKEVVWDLRKRGHRICIITSRFNTTETSLLGAVMRGLVRAWLKVNAIYYDEIVFCDDRKENLNKAQACRRLAVDVMVEDRKENLDLLKNLTRVIGFRTRNNQFYEDAAVVFVQSFREVKREIERMEALLQQEHKRADD